MNNAVRLGLQRDLSSEQRRCVSGTACRIGEMDRQWTRGWLRPKRAINRLTNCFCATAFHSSAKCARSGRAPGFRR